MTYLSPQNVTTGLTLDGHEILASHGIVRGIVVRSRSIIGNYFAGWQTIFGGNISIYRDLCEKARQDAFDQMVEHAGYFDANAIIGFRYDTTEIAPGVTEVLAYGTAVTVRPREATRTEAPAGPWAG